MISVGKYGEYVAKITVEIRGDRSISTGFSAIPVTDKLPSDKDLVDLYKFYQTLTSQIENAKGDEGKALKKLRERRGRPPTLTGLV